MREKKVSIAIADDHPLFREGLVSALKREKRFVVIGEVGNGQELIEIIGTRLPDLAIVDVDMPVMDGIEVARHLQRNFPQVFVIFLTMHKDSLILRSLRALGVRGYVLKDSAMQEIVICLDRVLKGKLYISPELSDLVSEHMSVGDATLGVVSSLHLLTRSEIRVIKRISNSMTTSEIAADLFVSARTVETHRHNICSKLNLSGTNRLLKFAIQHRDRIDALPEF